MVEQVNKEKDMETVYELAKTTLKGWKIEKHSLGVNATYLGTTKPYHVYVGIIQIMNSGYVVKFYCDFTNLLSADCIKVAHTDEELRSVLENLRTGVLYHLFGGLEERLNESMMEYLSEFERLL